MSGSSRITDACQPWDDVVSRKTGIAALAVDLDLVSGPDAKKTPYGNPGTFFRITHPTETLSEVVKDVFSRATGKDPHARGIFLIGTALGGGKSHILTALYHLAKQGSRAVPSELAQEFLNGLSFQPLRVVVLTHNAPAGGKEFPRTLWGELARQLDRPQMMGESDKALQAPRKEELGKLLQEEPTIILIDEVTNYIIRAAAIKVGGSTLAEQTRVFLQLLEEVVDRLTNTALVVSQLPEEIESEERRLLERVTKGMRGPEREEVERLARKEIRESAKLLLRKAEPETPVRNDAELVNILRRRIFKSINWDAADKVVEAYTAHFSSPGVRAVLPAEAVEREYATKLRRTYPFHPRTIAILRDKLSQAPKFMQTRGAVFLAILAARQICERKAGDLLIHPFHLDPRDSNIKDELATRVFEDTRVNNAIVTELIGGPDGPARAERQDQTFGAELGSRLTTAVLLESALVTHRGPQSPLVGASEAEILLDVLQPGDDETHAREALRSILETSYHIVPVGNKLVFQGEVNLNRYIEEKGRGIREPEIQAEVRRIVETHLLKGATMFERVWWPTSPENIPDTNRLQLAVLQPTDPWWHGDGEASEELSRLFTRKNQAGEPRRHKNTLVLLVPALSDKNSITEVVRRLLAVKEVERDERTVESLSPEQRKRLEGIRAKAEGTAILRVGIAYKVLFYPWHKGDSYRTPKLHHTPLTLTEQDLGVDTENWRAGRSRVLEVIHTRLRDEGKVKPSEEPFSPDWVRDRILTDRSGKTRDAMVFKEVEGAFSEDTSLPFPPGRDVLRDTVKRGIETDFWGVVSGKRLYTGHVADTLVLHDDSEIVLKGSGRWREIVQTFCERCGSTRDACRCEAKPPPAPPEKCPNCGRSKPECVCEVSFPDQLLKDVPAILAKAAKERRCRFGQVAVSVNLPRSVDTLLRLLPAFGGAQATAEVASLNVVVRARDNTQQEVALDARSPGPLWTAVKGAVETLLGQITSGKATGSAKVDVVVRLKAPADSRAIEELLQPFTMPGCETVKADIRARPEGP